MEYRQLGKWGVQVSILSFGSWITFGRQVTDRIAEECMDMAYNAGINFFDNAESYGSGDSEMVMGNILKKKNWDRSSYLVSSKVYWGGDKPNQLGLSRKHVFEACNAALKRLQLDYIDFFYCHRPDKKTPIEETVWTMHNLIQQGKILYWGTSEWSAQEITQAHLVAEKYNLIPPAMEQPQYNMFHRHRVEVEYAKLYKDFGMGTTIWSPLYSGVLSGKYNKGMPKEETRLKETKMDFLKHHLSEENLKKTKGLAKIAEQLGATLPQMAIAWCLKNPDVSTAILGASRPEQLEENLKAVSILYRLTDGTMEEIEGILENKPVPPLY